MNCPCGSPIPYLHCCGRYHRHESPVPDPVALVKARFSAFALGKVDFLLDTALSNDPRPRAVRRKELLTVCKATRFLKLEIHTSSGDETKGTVSFTVHFQRQVTPEYFTETSQFEKINGEWLYVSGETKFSNESEV